ncbi:MAG: hypothetical protein K1X56_07110 [Flavobacteriales bacterium]|nr:hypothetical protein [Flavobacteriales bacterium]
MEQRKNQSESASLGWLELQSQKFEEGRFAWMTILITFQSCLGSIACMYLLKGNSTAWLLAGCAMITMASNAMFIAQAPGKICLLVFYASVLINTLLIIVAYSGIA